ncbi:MAG TPA: hypothetical protein VFI25_08840 [Planctomycetota bacterium]|nr:hypothetical protein [Planctomycetota bacterium]
MATARGLLSEITFGAFLSYSPRGRGTVSILSRRWRDAIKQDAPGVLQRMAEEIGRNPSSKRVGLSGFFGGDVALVPTPRSAPLKTGALWPAIRICEELFRAGLAGELVPCLKRKTAVPKSAFAPPGDRPTARIHLDSMSIEARLVPSDRILVVDDFVTKGATLLAAVSLVRSAYPEADVRGFALVRTKGRVPDIEELVHPCVGRIRLTAEGETVREP